MAIISGQLCDSHSCSELRIFIFGESVFGCFGEVLRLALQPIFGVADLDRPSRWLKILICHYAVYPLITRTSQVILLAGVPSLIIDVET